MLQLFQIPDVNRELFRYLLAEDILAASSVCKLWFTDINQTKGNNWYLTETLNNVTVWSPMAIGLERTVKRIGARGYLAYCKGIVAMLTKPLSVLLYSSPLTSSLILNKLFLTDKSQYFLFLMLLRACKHNQIAIAEYLMPISFSYLPYYQDYHSLDMFLCRTIAKYGTVELYQLYQKLTQGLPLTINFLQIALNVGEPRWLSKVTVTELEGYVTNTIHPISIKHLASLVVTTTDVDIIKTIWLTQLLENLITLNSSVDDLEPEAQAVYYSRSETGLAIVDTIALELLEQYQTIDLTKILAAAISTNSLIIIRYLITTKHIEPNFSLSDYFHALPDINLETVKVLADYIYHQPLLLVELQFDCFQYIVTTYELDLIHILVNTAMILNSEQLQMLEDCGLGSQLTLQNLSRIVAAYGANNHLVSRIIAQLESRGISNNDIQAAIKSTL